MQGDIDLRRCVRVLKSRARFIIGGTLICSIVALAVSFLLPRVYRASLVLEVGKIYLSPGASRQEVQFIEDPESVAGIIVSDANLSALRQKLGFDIDLDKLIRRITIAPFRQKEYVKRSLTEDLLVGSPFLAISFEGASPEKALASVGFLGESIVSEHRQKFEANQRTLQAAVQHLEEKMAAIESIIAAEKRYHQLYQTLSDKGGQRSEQFSQGLDRMETSQASPTEILFLQSSSLTEKQYLTGLTHFQVEMEMSTGRLQQEIAEARMEAVDLLSRREMSTPTRIRSPAVLPERPVRPNKRLIVGITAVGGLIFLSLIALFQDYWNNPAQV